METEYKQFANRFAQAVTTRDYDTAHAMLADWLQPTVTADRLREMIEKEIREVCQANEIEEDVYPEDWDIDGNSSTLESLREEHSYVSERNSGWPGEERSGFSANGDLRKPIT